MILLLTLLLLLTFAIYAWKKQSYWSERGVYSPPCIPVIGHIWLFFSKTKHPWHKHDEFYRENKGKKFIGMYDFLKPRVFVIDPELVKKITVKDFDHFVDRRNQKTGHPKDKITESMIVNASNEEWKSIRNAITPTFTSGKLKAMFGLIISEADVFLEECHKLVVKGEIVDLLDYSSKYALNVIQNCAFGIQGDAFSNEELTNLIMAIMKLNKTALLKFLLFSASPTLFSLLGLYLTADVFLKFQNYVKDTLKKRRSSQINRGDFIDLLLEAEKEETGSKKVFNEDVIIAQSCIFLAAGLDTVKNNLSWLYYHLAKYKEEQEKVRKDLIDCDVGEEFTYQNLQKTEYLDAFISETFRMYPGAYMMERQCTKDYQIPDSDYVIPSGTIVSMPTYSFHYDEEYWPTPEIFNPERFLKENKEEINPYTYLPFGIGPRNCIGMRFALLELKVALAKMVLKYDISVAPGFEPNIKFDASGMKPDDNGIKVVLKLLEE